MPISYSGRTYQEGKKINWRDGVRALLGHRPLRALRRDLRSATRYGSQILARLGRAPRFNAWMADVIRPFCGQRVLEIGGGVGNLTLQLVPRWTFVVSDINPLYLQTLESLRTSGRTWPSSIATSPTLASFPRPAGRLRHGHLPERHRARRRRRRGARATSDRCSRRRPGDRAGAAGTVELRHPRRGARATSAATRRAGLRAAAEAPDCGSSASSSSTASARSPGSSTGACSSAGPSA